MILLVTNQRDLTTDYIVRELKNRSIPYHRLNTENLPSYKCSIGHSHIDDWNIGEITGSCVKAAYFRRPKQPEPKGHNCSQDIDKYLSIEWLSFLKSIYSRLNKKWFSNPNDIVLAEDKPLQLLLANRLGFCIPKAAITNDIKPAISLSREHHLIAKPLRQALIENESEQVIFTNRIKPLEPNNEMALSYCPIILQQEISKKFDVRVTVVGDRVFAAAIHSQKNIDTTTDWRKGGIVDLAHEPIDLPKAISQQCIDLTKKLNLRFGAIDLICDKQDNYWFLEINPNGQWAWIENRIQAPIAKAIVDELLKIGESN
ncbi:hypothetical protein [Vibrio sp. SCSIO 43169]|uniref:hypothetical protein n=1 Tax=Vibrio sp. SCSIO 43169 TaxID=2822801 RepID=UPI0020432C84|nr:hypothetical protein [Vibrio sp. SCSIO 43169]MCM5507146.1 hypothetical protein [Vibrio sp. SCSIO 43169]